MCLYINTFIRLTLHASIHAESYIWNSCVYVYVYVSIYVCIHKYIYQTHSAPIHSCRGLWKSCVYIYVCDVCTNTFIRLTWHVSIHAAGYGTQASSQPLGHSWRRILGPETWLVWCGLRLFEHLSSTCMCDIVSCVCMDMCVHVCTYGSFKKAYCASRNMISLVRSAVGHLPRTCMYVWHRVICTHGYMCVHVCMYGPFKKAYFGYMISLVRSAVVWTFVQDLYVWNRVICVCMDMCVHACIFRTLLVCCALRLFEHLSSTLIYIYIYIYIYIHIDIYD
jgi:hypothetical protein